MNREMKFRAWHEATKTMHNDVNPFRWDFVILNSWHKCEKSTGSGILGSGGNTAEMLVPAARYDYIMQYTGLKGKNGKEIYEGDIVKMEWSTVNTGKYFQSDDMWNDHETIVKVEWRNIGFVFIEKNGRQHNKRSSATIEVIGNIYQNPELL